MNFIIKFFNLVIKIIGTFIVGLIKLLPNSPFKTVNDLMLDSDLLQYFNWLFPVNIIVSILIIWVGCIVAFYSFNFILKLLHLR